LWVRGIHVSPIFLLVFSYMILCKFVYHEEINDEIILNNGKEAKMKLKNDTSNTSDELFVNSSSNLFMTSSTTTLVQPVILLNKNEKMVTNKKKKISSASWMEWLLIFWVFTFIVEEIRQVGFIILFDFKITSKFCFNIIINIIF
jgi:hypothetical protein